MYAFKLLALTTQLVVAIQTSHSDPSGQFFATVESLPDCAKYCLQSAFQVTLGVSHLDAGVITREDIVFACQDPTLDDVLQSCKTCQQEGVQFFWTEAFSDTCRSALSQDTVDINVSKGLSYSSPDWSPYYNTTMTNFDWINLREGIKSIIQMKQYGPVILRLSWHDAATGNVFDGTGGPHATMLIQDPQDSHNKGLQRAIDALAPLYKKYQTKISNADLWSYAGAVAIRVMGGPVISWRPGRNDITNIRQARLTEANRIPDAKDSWHALIKKFETLGMNATDFAALIHGGHGVGRCHREYSGYYGPWTGQENTFSNFYGTPLGKSPSKNESLPEINSWQLTSTNEVNGGQILALPSDNVMITGILDLDHSPTPGVPGPNADRIFQSFDNKDSFFKYFAPVFGRLLEVTLDGTKLGGWVSTDPADPFGWIPTLAEIPTMTRQFELHLIGQWYTPASQARASELVRVLATNTNNSYITKIHMIQPKSDFKTSTPRRSDVLGFFESLRTLDPYFPWTLFLQKLVVSTTNHEGRLLASDAFRYASFQLKQDIAKLHLTKIAILANQDVYFDESLSLLWSSPYSDLGRFTAYFLSRYEEPDAEDESLIGTQCGPKFIGSHDAFMFQPPLPEPLIRNTAFELGSWGIEARLLWEFEQFGIEGRNPCEDIKIWHVHRGGVKDGVNARKNEVDNSSEVKSMPEVNTHGKSSIAFPDKLKTKFKRVVDELWGVNLASKKK
ncbi:hypothetical protein HDU79_002859 [Rhizoclosmatium sp. JEL0117]|nr:hypothetical protein HDU79_002859 [Rhizoclosmatium sp. JEL0117]